MQQQLHGVDRGFHGGYSQYGPAGTVGGPSLAPQRQPGPGIGQQQMPNISRPVGGSLPTSIGMGLAQDNGQGQHFMGQPVGISRGGYGNGQGIPGMGNSLGGGMYGGRNDIIVGGVSSIQQRSDSGLQQQQQYDSSSNFPLLSSTSSGRFSGLPNQSQLRDEDFVIQNEDFPALPGAGANPVGGAKNELGLGGLSVLGLGLPSQDRLDLASQMQSLGGSLAQPQQQQRQQPGDSLNTLGSVGLGGLGAGGLLSSLSGGQSPLLSAQSAPVAPRAADAVTKDSRYGLAGLLDVIRMTDRDLNTLALGSDLTTFGLNLNSADSLFAAFTSPFSDQPAATDPQYTTPSCYLMQHPPSLKTEHFTKFQIDTLFYMFYSMPRDILQALSAQELYRRDWRYHGELRLWLKARSPQELMQGHPGVQFLYFDVQAWDARLFTSTYRGNLAAGLLSEEEIRVKPPSQTQQGANPLAVGGSLS